jgi:outer membrane protein assembly factor BamB
MKPKEILLLGVKGTLAAFDKKTGRRIWSTPLKTGMTADFVTVLADDTRVYAHTGGELFCVDLFDGSLMWADKLPGMGYGIASLAMPGFGSTFTTVMAEKIHQDAQTAATTQSTSH